MLALCGRPQKAPGLAGGALAAPQRCRAAPLPSRAGVVRCQQQLFAQSTAQRQNDSLMLLSLKFVMLVTAANATVACMPLAAQAAAWQPRRHFRHRLEKKYRTMESATQSAARKAADKAAQVTQQVQRTEPAAVAGEAHRWLQEAQRNMKSWWEKQPVYSVGLSNRQQAYTSGAPPSPSPFGWVALWLAAGIAFLLMFGRRLRLSWRGRQRGSGGRWVMDRSLGGKMIFIPDAEPSSTTSSRQTRPLWEEQKDTGDKAAAAVVPAPIAGPWATPPPASLPSSSSEAEPDWWQPPSFVVYTTPERKDELRKQARLILRQLEDAKLLQGLDYSLSGLVSLRTVCQEAGGYQVKPRTDSGRDAMLRAGVRAAISAAQEGRYSLLGGDHPARFVCGLAHDLGVPDKRAATIVHAEVAAVCRSALIDAEAAYRASNDADVLLALLRVAGTLQVFPLPRGSAEAELVAAGITKQTSLEFRKAIFFEFGAVSPELAALVAELLGFNPELVMPALRQQQAAAAPEAAGRQTQQRLGG